MVSYAQKAIKSDAVERMTDVSQYTGTHKERFDETGKGRGMAGRDSTAKGRGSTPALVSGQAGYVAGYKNEGTYSSPKQQPKRVCRVQCGKFMVCALGSFPLCFIGTYKP